MTALTETLMGIEAGYSFKFSNISRLELTCVSTTVSRLNGDFDRRKIHGEDTTFILDVQRDDKRGYYNAVVTRYKGILPKRGNRFVRPTNPLLAD